jgi:hypothetical protein
MNSTGIKAIETRYKGYRFRSRLEARWAVFFETLGIGWEYEKEGFVLQDGTYYLPDFYIPHLNLWVEIKPALPSNPAYPAHDENIEWPCHPLSDTDNDGVPINSIGAPWVLIAGEPYAEGIEGCCFLDFTAYEAFPDDCGHIFCECRKCGFVGIEFEGRASRLRCGCPKQDDKGNNPASPRLLKAYRAARSARFEHGETPA